MSQIVLDLDEDLLIDAALELGTKTKAATVQQALAYFQTQYRRRRAADLLGKVELNLSEEELKGAWR